MARAGAGSGSNGRTLTLANGRGLMPANGRGLTLVNRPTQGGLHRRRPIEHDPGVSIRALMVLAALAAAFATACSETPVPPLKVERNLLTVDNRTDQDWLGVEIWINRQYRITTSRIAAHSRFSSTLDMFVAGWGQRFDIRRQRIDSLVLTARTPEGTPVSHALGSAHDSVGD